MTGYGWFKSLGLRDKLIAMVLPLVVLPAVVAGSVVGYVASREAYEGITKTSRDDLDHMAAFTVDLLNSHRLQFEVYREDKKETIRADLGALVNFAVDLVEAEDKLYRKGTISLAEAKSRAAEAIKKVSVGQSGYAYAMTGKGVLVAHIAREGDDIINEVDGSGRPFIREMCERALQSSKGEVLHTVYPWKNALLGDERPRDKTVAYRYYAPWDWIVAAGSYLNETYEDRDAEAKSLEDLKNRLKEKRVGLTGYIYALDAKGTAMIHPFREGESLIGEVDGDGRAFVKEMVENKSGWIRYPWRNTGDAELRMKVVRYVHFEPWDWTIAVGSYENEFFSTADAIKARTFMAMFITTGTAAVVAVILLLWASKVFTNPVARMTEVIRNVRGGNLDERMNVATQDELGELANAYNTMIDVVREHREMEQELAQQGKLASLGLLSSTVAHEINNPLGVILGYAAFLEKKLDESDPNYEYVAHIRREAKRSKKILQDLLSYSRETRPKLGRVDINALLHQIAGFSSHHPSMQGVEIDTRFDEELPLVDADGDQIRQLAMNLILNGGDAMGGEGTLTIETRKEGVDRVTIRISDTGPGIPADVAGKVFEPFFTTKTRGTGLGLAISSQIVRRHQGQIEVDLTREKGASILITLPVRHKEF